MKKSLYTLVILFLICITSNATEFNIDKSKKNLVKFISDAPIEDFEGITELIDGYMYWEGDDMMNNSQLYFEVDLNTIDTGIGLRNRHMRDNYLETDKFRYASYKGTFNNIKKISENNYEVEVKGSMNIHGVTKPLTLKGKIMKNQNGLRIQSQFNISLLDHRIEVPEFMFLKISEIMDLRIDFYMKEKK
jgi:polyisoprenoid-binding protein YceI